MTDDNETLMRIEDRVAALERQFAAMEKQVSAVPEINKAVTDLHRKLLEPSAAGDPPLLDRVGKAVRTVEQTSWVGKSGIWLVLTLGGLAGAATALFNFVQRLGK